MRTVRRILLGVLALSGVAVAGLLVKPKPPAAPEGSRDLGRLPLRDGLPGPVARWAREVAAHGLPRIETAVVAGRGVIRRGPLRIPFRFRGEYVPAREYDRAIDLTWFGLPVARARDTFVHGRGTMSAFGRGRTGPDMDQGANMAAWAESLWLPPVLLTDRRARWEPVDDTHARLVFPFGEGEDSITYEFDAGTGRPRVGRAMRYKAGEDHRTEWVVRSLEWRTVRGMLVPVKSDVRWGDEGRPWATFEIDDLALNVPVPALGG